MSVALYGLGVSRGIALGYAHIARRRQLEIEEKQIDSSNVAIEIGRFQQAMIQVREDLANIRKTIPPSTPSEIYEFVDIHSLILQDTTLTEPPVELISQHQCNAEWALQIHRHKLAAAFDEMSDPYLRSRMSDIDQVIDRIQHQLHEQQNHQNEAQPADQTSLRSRIFVVDDLSPADLITLNQQGISGLVSESGGPLSHTAILARSLKVPAAMGVRHARQLLNEGENLILDGERGMLLADVNKDMQRHYRQRIREEKKRQQQLAQHRKTVTHTACGTRINIQANLDFPEDLSLIKKEGADGIGLYRTEYLFMNRQQPPSEDEQFDAYSEVVSGLKGKPVTIRTLDVGADKPLAGDRFEPGGPMNPALGLRAIRLCLADQSIFIPQLRAMLRSSVYGPIRILIPMLCNAQEMFQTKNLIQQIETELVKKKQANADNIEIGGMIETPAAAISASVFAKYLDFLSIGTNDLIQYTLAIDRVDDQVSYLYDPLHPAILKLIHNVIDAGNRNSTPVSMCGEMAADVRFTRLLLYLGLRDFSMHPATLLEVKQQISQTHLSNLTIAGRRLMRASNPDRIQQLVRDMNHFEKTDSDSQPALS